MSLSSGDRRPVKSRSWKVSQVLAAWLVSKNCSPNFISVIGMTAGLCGGAAMATTMTSSATTVAILFFVAILCIQVRLLANLLDGMVAIQSGKASRVGELFNEVPDRVSDTALLVGAGLASGNDPQLGLWAALAAMATAYVRTTGKTAGAPMDFCGPMAKQHRMAVLTIACLICSLVAPSHAALPMTVMMIALWLILIGSVVTTIRRLWRIARFLQDSSLREAT